MPQRALADRLALLRGTGPPASALDALPPAIASRLSASLAARLSRVARLGERPRAQEQTAALSSNQELASRLGGVLASPGLIRIDDRLALPVRLGDVRIDDSALHAARLHALGLSCARRPGDLLFIDTETTGLSGGTGTTAFMVGAARLTPDAVALTQWLLAGPSGEAAMLDAMALELARSNAIASYNGKAFDVPLLRARLTLLGRPDPFNGLAHADLLHVARRLARERPCADLRLCSIESRWLGSTRLNDLPGSAAPQAWRQWLTDRDPGGVQEVLQHNRRDLIALVALTAYSARIMAGLFAGATA